MCRPTICCTTYNVVSKKSTPKYLFSAKMAVQCGGTRNVRIVSDCIRVRGRFWAFFRRSKPKKIQKSSEKHTLISFDSLLTTTNIVRSLRCFDVFTSFRWYARRLANTFIRQKRSVMPFRSIAYRQYRILYGVCGVLTYFLRFRCHDEENTVFSRNPRNRYRSRRCP